ncbi:phosphopantetheine-binding protein [Streptomyces sp. B6B3]|uniref:phosphopantetheine-binding protein n=1 Tax=Streptomyces sp. B6B3 TaxID=3153570 RepID=UPI00325E538B
MTEDDYVSVLVKFIGEEFLPADAEQPLDDSYPLMESGLLDSLRVAVLMTWIRDELGLYISPAHLDVDHFRDVRTIARMLHELSARSETESEVQGETA